MTAADLARPVLAPHPPMSPTLTPRTPRALVGRTVKYFLLIFSVIVVLMPLYVLVVTSFKSGREIGVTGQWTLPQHWTTASWAKAWTAGSATQTANNVHFRMHERS